MSDKRWKVLISAPYMQPIIERFRADLETRGVELFVPPVMERFEEGDLLGFMADVDGAITGDDRFTRRVLEASPKLKVISKWGTGIDSIDRQACAEMGIAVRNTPNAFSEPVADSVLGYMLCFARNLPWLDRNMKSGVWHKIDGRTLGESTIGVIGVGDVGKAIVKRAAAFGGQLLGNDIKAIDPAFTEQHGLEMTSKEDLLRRSDFVVTSCDLNPTSYHLMSDVEFMLMQPTAVFINCARGPIVDEPALVRALENKTVAGAALDVFEHEPLPVDSPLLKMDNVMLSPHNTNSSPRCWEHVHHNTIRNLLDVLENGPERG
jgi:D-3-phosphoglycerate dehydrogenase